jgi:hypothetical protein
MSRKLHRHLSKHWILKEQSEPISTMPLNTFNTLTGVQQREYVRSLIRLGFGTDAHKYKHHLKRLN